MSRKFKKSILKMGFLNYLSFATVLVCRSLRDYRMPIFTLFFCITVKKRFIIRVHQICILIAFSLYPNKNLSGKFCFSFLKVIQFAIVSCKSIQFAQHSFRLSW
jgi:hypothetical protein